MRKRTVDNNARIKRAPIGLTTSSAILDMGGTVAPKSADSITRKIDFNFGDISQIVTCRRYSITC
jgi:hypothetical protein